MGQRGPKPLPANVHLLHNNPSKKSAAALLDDIVRPEVAIPSCPAHLTPEGRAEWKRITPHLERLGLISELDRAALAAYCASWSDFVWAEKRIAEITRQAKDKTGEKGRVHTTPNGYQQTSVPFQIRNRALELMQKYLAEFGLSPAQRSRVSAGDPQLSLPGVDKPAEGGWGTFK